MRLTTKSLYPHRSRISAFYKTVHDFFGARLLKSDFQLVAIHMQNTAVTKFLMKYPVAHGKGFARLFAVI